jgi:two-component system response regulator NreC
MVDDHSMVRAGLTALLEADGRCEVVAEAGTLEQLRSLLATTAADVVVLDLSIGGEDALGMLPEIVAGSNRPRVLVLTMHDDPRFAREALGRGADGYLLKDAAAEELSRAIETVMAGGNYLMPELGARMVRGRPTPADRLTARERDVLRLLALGYTNTEIAAELFVSLRTVEAHRASLRSRLGAGSRAELVEVAHRLGLAT